MTCSHLTGLGKVKISMIDDFCVVTHSPTGDVKARDIFQVPCWSCFKSCYVLSFKIDAVFK